MVSSNVREGTPVSKQPGLWHLKGRARWVVLAPLLALVAFGVQVPANANTRPVVKGVSAVAARTKSPIRIAVMNYGNAFPYTASIYRGMEKAAKAAGVKLSDFDADGEVSNQLNEVNEIISLKPAGVLMMPIDSESSVAMVRDFNKAKIPVVAVATSVGPSNAAPTYVNSGLVALVNQNEVAASAIAGQLALKALPKGGQIGVITGAPGSAADEQRLQDFYVAAKNAGVDFQTVATAQGGWIASTSQAACQNILAAHPDVQLFYAESDDMAVGCAAAITAAQSTAKVIGIGGEAIALSPIKAGDSPIVGTVCYEPISLGSLAFTTLYNDLTGKKRVHGVFITYHTPGVTKANASSCVPQW